MASIVDICNMALVSIGEDRIVSLDETGKIGVTCNALWVPTRDYVQSLHTWPECMKRATLTASTTSPNHEWSYAYVLPADYLALDNLYEHSALQGDYSVEANLLLTNYGTANIRYIAKVSDTTKWSPELVEITKLKLAMDLVMALSARQEIYNMMASQFTYALEKAKGTTARRSRPRPVFESSWITARSGRSGVGRAEEVE
jgi:hypothetical protein